MISIARTHTVPSATPSGAGTSNDAGVSSRPRCIECVTQSGNWNGGRSNRARPSSATTSPSISTRVTLRSSRSSKNTMSAHLPGAMEPKSWSIWKHCAQLMVTIWMAVTAPSAI